ncbi:UPF0149 family protein [Bradyrhizobium sp. CB1717]|nr:UPF0149 family protein [Bradyrhizobium sp. CB1717]WFU29012.1 UPF0149 family protein [Bradyrhizobium sp. CB1717]
MPTLDGYVAAIVTGPVSMSPLDWICPLLAIDADAFNHVGTPDFAAISAVALHHNEIRQTLSTTPRQFAPMHRREANGDIDASRCGSGCRRGRRCWTPATSITACCCPSCCTVATIRAVRCSDRREAAAKPRTFSATPTSIFERPSRRCANTGCRSATHAPADHCGCGSAYRLRPYVWRRSLGRQHAGSRQDGQFVAHVKTMLCNGLTITHL